MTLLFCLNDANLIASMRRGAGVGKDGMLIPMAGEASRVRPEGRKASLIGTVQKLRCEFSP